VALLLGCGGAGPSGVPDDGAARTPAGAGTAAGEKTQAVPPDVTADVEARGFRLHWDTYSQELTLGLTNGGDREATVWALLYGTNNSISPPRRELLPNGDVWMRLAGKAEHGDLTPQDVERHWRDDPFKGRSFPNAGPRHVSRTWHVSAKGFRATLAPHEKKAVELAPLVTETSDLGAWKGEPLERVGFDRVDVWLFGPDGTFFSRREVRVEPDPRRYAEARDAETRKDAGKPEVKKPADGDGKGRKGAEAPAPADPEQAAARQLKFARELLGDADAAGRDGDRAGAERMRERAGERLRDLARQYPGTRAAAEARDLLEKMGR
jgi:hypothetical protein